MNSTSKIFLIFLFIISQLNAMPLSFSGKLSKWQEFEITSKLISFQLSVESDEAENGDLFVADLIDPNGKVIIKNNIDTPMSYRVPPKLYSTLRNELRPTYVTPGLFSVVVDKNPIKGKWKFRLGKRAVSTSIRTTWNLTRAYSSYVEQPSLKIDVLTSNSFVSINPQLLKLALTKVQDLYDSYGIKIRFSDQVQWQDPLAEISDLEKKLAAVSPVKRKRPTLYLINRINSSVAKDFQGLAGCLPGFHVQVIKAHCALLVSISDKPEDNFNLNKLTKVISHEIAHLLGLFHLEDDFYPFGIIMDPFEDTSIEKDLINVMHKTSEFFGLLEFSQSQVRKMRSQPLLYQSLTR